jgi:hypothetical protein
LLHFDVVACHFLFSLSFLSVEFAMRTATRQPHGSVTLRSLGRSPEGGSHVHMRVIWIAIAWANAVAGYKFHWPV